MQVKFFNDDLKSCKIARDLCNEYARFIINLLIFPHEIFSIAHLTKMGQDVLFELGSFFFVPS